MAADRTQLEAAVRHLAAIDRPSASTGERQAADWIAARLEELGCEARVEEEQAHGTYWWPLGALTAIGGIAGLMALRRPSSRTRRAAAVLAGAFAAAGVADDIDSGRHWFRRRFLPRRSTWNVVAEAGDRDAERTVVLVAHHDAAHGGLIFNPAIPESIARIYPDAFEVTDTSPPLMAPVYGGPAMVALGALLRRRGLLSAGTALSLAAALAFAEIAGRSVVPGANDNLTGVATLLGVGAALRERPISGLRVLLVSTGSEESFMEGMRAFAARHFGSLPPERTHVICIDTVGSPELIQLEGEGMIRMRHYDKDFRKLVSDCAADCGVNLRRGMRLRNATDGLVALKAGYPSVCLASMDHYKQPSNYHHQSDVPDNVVWETLADAVTLCDTVVRRLALDGDRPAA